MSFPVAAVVVTHNSAEHVGACLGALGEVAEVVVVDNASQDATCDAVGEHGRVRLVANAANAGFAAAVNQGIAETRAPYVLVLNPDAVVQTGWDQLLAAFADERVAAATGRLVGADGVDQTEFHVRNLPTAGMLGAEALLLNRVWPSNRWNRAYRASGFDREQAQDVEQPSGAFLLVRRTVLEELGGMDERFHPLWFEDVDLCQRIRDLDRTIRYVPEAVAVHAGGHSIPSLSRAEREEYWYGNLLRFGDKHFAARGYAALKSCVLAGLVLRWIASWGVRSGGEARRAYMRAFRTTTQFKSPVLVAPSSRAASPHSLASNPE